MTTERKEKLLSVARSRKKDCCVVLENIVDPHNAAAILRTCDAFGIQTVHYICETVPMYDLKKVGKSSSSSANKWIDVKKWSRSSDCCDELIGKGFSIIATALYSAESLYEFTWPEKVAIVFGNEKDGVSEGVKGRSMAVTIPMNGMVQSLNVSVTAGIVLAQFAQYAKPVSENEAQWLYEDFLKR